MKTHPLFARTLIAAAGLLIGSASLAVAADNHAKDSSAAADSTSPEWLAQAKASYPLSTCVVSDEQLGGEKEKPFDYVHKEAGKPDRLIRFCCEDCLADFKKEPAKYLKQLDTAAAQKKSETKK